MDEEFDSFGVDEVETFDEPIEVETFDEPMDVETLDDSMEIEQDTYEPMEFDDVDDSMDLNVETLDDSIEVDEDSLIIDEAMSVTDDIQDDNDVLEIESTEETDISSMDETADSDPMQDMAEYMSEHNYGREDYETYSKDPEYQAINDRLLEADGQDPVDYNADSDPMQDMAEYMSEHNYGREDYETYSKDPEYQAINDRLLEADGQDPIEYGTSDTDFESQLNDNVINDMDEESSQDYIYETTEETDDSITDSFGENLETEEVTDEVVSDVTEETEDNVTDSFEENLETEEVTDEIVTDVAEETEDNVNDSFEENLETEEVTDEVVTDVSEETQDGVSDSFEENLETEEVTDEVVTDVTEETEDNVTDVFEENLETEEVTDEVVTDVTEETEDGVTDGFEENLETEEVTDEVVTDVTEETEDNVTDGFEENLETEEVTDEVVLNEVDNSTSLDEGVLVTNVSDTTENIENYEVPGDLSNLLGNDEFEDFVKLENPEFYETGSFYTQGINEYGYEGTCGPTSQANAINTLLGTNEFTENKVLTVAVENDLCETSSLDPADNGGTTTDEFMELYGKINEKLDGKLNVERYDYENALSVNEMADKLDEGAVLNIAVDANTLWDSNNHIPGIMGQDKMTDHWITVTGVDRNPDGSIAGFKLIDSGGGENYADVDKYERMCFGEPGREMLDPTCIVVSKKDDVKKHLTGG